MSERVQLRRTKGYRKPAGAVVVARPSKWGNPFTIAGAMESGFAGNPVEARRLCVEAFSSWLAGEHTWAFTAGAARRERILADLHELKGRDLACYCPPDQPCHGDVLIAVANPEGTNQ